MPMQRVELWIRLMQLSDSSGSWRLWWAVRCRPSIPLARVGPGQAAVTFSWAVGGFFGVLSCLPHVEAYVMRLTV